MSSFINITNTYRQPIADAIARHQITYNHQSQWDNYTPRGNSRFGLEVTTRLPDPAINITVKLTLKRAPVVDRENSSKLTRAMLETVPEIIAGETNPAMRNTLQAVALDAWLDLCVTRMQWCAPPALSILQDITRIPDDNFDIQATHTFGIQSWSSHQRRNAAWLVDQIYTAHLTVPMPYHSISTDVMEATAQHIGLWSGFIRYTPMVFLTAPVAEVATETNQLLDIIAAQSNVHITRNIERSHWIYNDVSDDAWASVINASFTRPTHHWYGNSGGTKLRDIDFEHQDQWAASGGATLMLPSRDGMHRVALHVGASRNVWDVMQDIRTRCPCCPSLGATYYLLQNVDGSAVKASIERASEATETPTLKPEEFADAFGRIKRLSITHPMLSGKFIAHLEA